MKAMATLAVAVALGVAACAQSGDDARPASAPEAAPAPDITSGTQPIFIPAAGLQWFAFDSVNAPGVMMATLWGDPTGGAFGAFVRLPAGFTSPLHTHTHAMKVVFLSGTYIQEPDGGSVVRLGPGGFMMQPGGDYRHRTSCDASADCVFFLESAGGFDLLVVDQSPGSP
jgi:beta-alanine degradation protein BauB